MDLVTKQQIADQISDNIERIKPWFTKLKPYVPLSIRVGGKVFYRIDEAIPFFKRVKEIAESNPPSSAHASHILKILNEEDWPIYQEQQEAQTVTPATPPVQQGIVTEDMLKFLEEYRELREIVYNTAGVVEQQQAEIQELKDLLQSKDQEIEKLKSVIDNNTSSVELLNKKNQGLQEDLTGLTKKVEWATVTIGELQQNKKPWWKKIFS